MKKDKKDGNKSGATSVRFGSKAELDAANADYHKIQAALIRAGKKPYDSFNAFMLAGINALRKKHLKA